MSVQPFLAPRFTCAVITAITSLAFISQVDAAIAPYSENFDSSGATPAGFTEAANADWSVVSNLGGQGYRVNVARTPSSGTGAPSASVAITNPVTATWTMQTDVKLTAFSSDSNVGSTTRIGFGALGSSAAFATTPFYLFDWVLSPGASGRTVVAGSIRILENGGNETTAVVNSGTGPGTPLVPNTTDTFRMSVTAVPNGASGVSLTYTVTNLTTSNFVTATANYNTALAGTHFGLRNTLGTPVALSTLDATFDNFSVTVPEPASAVSVLAMLTAMAAGRTRARRRRL